MTLNLTRALTATLTLKPCSAQFNGQELTTDGQVPLVGGACKMTLKHANMVKEGLAQTVLKDLVGYESQKVVFTSQGGQGEHKKAAPQNPPGSPGKRRRAEEEEDEKPNGMDLC